MSGLVERLALLLRAPDMRPRAEIEADVREEVLAHLALAAADAERTGLAPDDARREALRRFGDVEQVVAACRDVRMEERIMLQRVLAVLVVVLVAVTALNAWATLRARAAWADDVAGLRAEVASLGRSLATARAPAAAEPAAPAFDAAVPLGLLPEDPSRRVYVLGKVGAPGAVTWRKGLTVSMVVAECGGLAKFADASRISIVREGGFSEPYDLAALLTGTTAGDREGAEPRARRVFDPELRPGDRVIVPEAFF